MKKVLLISNMYPSKSMPYRGIFVKNQYEYLIENYNVNISFIYSNTNVDAGIKSLLSYFILFIKSIKHFFIRYNIVHVHYFYLHFVIAYLYKLFYPKTKIFVSFHGTDYKFLCGKSIFSKFYRWMAKIIDFSIAVGNEQLTKIKKQLSSSKEGITLCAGVDKRKYYKVSSVNKIYDFIFVGNLTEVKGIDILMNIIKKYNQKYIFCIVGDGPLYKEVKDVCDNYSVDYLHAVPQNDLVNILNKSRMLVLPSREDSFGLVVTEAMYCGLPVIVSGASGLKQQVIHGFNGFVVEPLTIKNLADALEKCYDLTDKQYKILSENAINSNKKYEMKRVCDTIIKIYNN